MGDLLQEALGRHDIIGIHAGHQRVATGRQSKVEGIDQAFLRVVDDAYALVPEGLLPEPGTGAVRALVVYSDQFPVRVFLSLNAAQAGRQGIQSIVEGQQNTDE